MDRKDFLKLTIKGAAAAGAIYCVGCANPVSSSPAKVNLTLNLNDSANSALKTTGGYVYNSGLIIINEGNNVYKAFSKACTHEGVTVEYLKGSNQMYCSAHRSYFNGSNGAVISGPAGSSLKEYNVTLNGTSLTITG